ncbi:hypothetical protein KP509_33G060600 [Ceratopteris richardii]|uniref:IC97/Casc1 N-terminal domain-containing protein n=1 Tax=Ceratopteris richardii TaxID=49495 RepID=A0A8T2QQC1_CERRI|nr:hypothetical protein KP509_33G060600 [Ceratopteris richardii]
MPPKTQGAKKKSSKKQLKEKKKEEAKKLAEERKKLAEEEAKRLEEERRIAWEAEQARLEAENARILQEKELLCSFYEWRFRVLADLEVTVAKQDEWDRFLEAGTMPHASDEGRMSNYFESIKNSWDEDYDSALLTACNIYQVFLNTEETLLLEQCKGDTFDTVKRFEDYLQKLQFLMQKRMDHTTAYLLHKSYEVYKQTNESSFFAINGDWKVYLWVNHMKNPRLRVLNEPTLQITISIPKAFAFANVAIRLYHQSLNPPSESTDVYVSVGGILMVDILSIPPSSRSAKGWTFEHVTMMTNSVSRLGYPFAGDSAPSPIGLEFILPSNIIVSETVPEVGWWDDEEHCWKKDGITELEYDKMNRNLRFQTLRARPHAVIQSRVKYYPYHSWILTPISETKALFVLETHGNAIKIEIGRRWCRLLDTPFPECNHIIGQDLDPLVLLKRLSRCGLHLMPVDSDSELVCSCIKESKVERYVCDDIAIAITACAIASSKWNAEADRDSCVVRILEIPDPCFPPTFEKSKDIRMVLYKAKGNAILNMSERKSKEYKEELLGEFHASIMVTLREIIGQNSLEKMEKGDPGFTDCFKCLALGLRLFSFTAVEPPPAPVEVVNESPLPADGSIQEQTEEAAPTTIESNQAASAANNPDIKEISKADSSAPIS